jgi:hypothetical protein
MKTMKTSEIDVIDRAPWYGTKMRYQGLTDLYVNRYVKPGAMANADRARLDMLAAHIHRGLEEIHSATRRNLETALEVGNRLRESKELVIHGQWLDYLKYCGLDARRASEYMRLSEHADTLTPTEIGRVSDLKRQKSIRAVIKEIREAREESRASRMRYGRPSYAVEASELEASEVEAAEVEPKPEPEDAKYRSRSVKERLTQAARDNAEREAERPARERRLTRAQDLVTAGYKVLAQKIHPDHKGGSSDEMAELNEIRDRLQAMVEEAWAV